MEATIRRLTRCGARRAPSVWSYPVTAHPLRPGAPWPYRRESGTIVLAGRQPPLRRGKDTSTRLPFSVGVAFEKTARAKMRMFARSSWTRRLEATPRHGHGAATAAPGLDMNAADGAGATRLSCWRWREATPRRPRLCSWPRTRSRKNTYAARCIMPSKCPRCGRRQYAAVSSSPVSPSGGLCVTRSVGLVV